MCIDKEGKLKLTYKFEYWYFYLYLQTKLHQKTIYLDNTAWSR